MHWPKRIDEYNEYKRKDKIRKISMWKLREGSGCKFSLVHKLQAVVLPKMPRPQKCKEYRVLHVQLT